jgi:hypothetical protein
MQQDSVDLAPSFFFKPVDSGNTNLDSSDTGSLSGDPSISPLAIFRESTDDIDQAPPLPEVQRANPISDPSSMSSSSEEDLVPLSVDDGCRVVVSPYPFSHTSQEEIEEREQLWAGSWTSDMPATELVQNEYSKFLFQVDYARFFERTGCQGEVMDCDDFSLSSKEAHSISPEDLCISEDPESFWERGVEDVPLIDRTNSPAMVSLGESYPSSPRA